MFVQMRPIFSLFALFCFVAPLNPAALADEGRQNPPPDYARQMAEYRKKADAGDAAAMNSIGLLYQNGLGVTQDYAQAMTWFRKAADAGNTDGALEVNRGSKLHTAF